LYQQFFDFNWVNITQKEYGSYKSIENKSKLEIRCAKMVRMGFDTPFLGAFYARLTSV